MSLSSLGRAKIIFCLFVCFPVDSLNGALTETGRDAGTAVFCSPISEPMGGNLLREAGTGGEDTRSTPVGL